MTNNEIVVSLLAGNDIPVPELQTIMHSPTLKEITMIGEEKYFQSMNLICLEKEYLIQDETLLSQLSNFQVLMKVLGEPSFASKKDDLIELLSLVFSQFSQIIFTPRSIVLRQGDITVMIDENNFEIVQKYLKQVFCAHNVLNGDKVVYNPANKKAKEIADKLMRGRARAAELNQTKWSSICGKFMSVICVALHYTFDQCASLNLAQLFDLVQRFGLKNAWEVDLRIRVAGGKPDKEPDDWMKDLYV